MAAALASVTAVIRYKVALTYEITALHVLDCRTTYKHGKTALNFLLSLYHPTAVPRCRATHQAFLCTCQSHLRATHYPIVMLGDSIIQLRVTMIMLDPPPLHIVTYAVSVLEV